MKIAMLGVGGIGGYYAARLIDGGHELSLVARGEHLNALKLTGLEVQHSDWSFHQTVTADDFDAFITANNAEDFDLVCVAVKAQAVFELAPKLATWFSSASKPPAVISLQNGVDSEVHLSRHLGANHVIGALCIGIGAHIATPGKIVSTGPGRIVMGLWPNDKSSAPGAAKNILATLNDDFNRANIPTEITADVQQQLWRKLVINNGLNPLSALTELDTQALSHHPEYQHVIRGLMLETITAATADGVTLSESVAEEMLEFMQGFDAIKTSMLVDKEKGRELELEAISGCVLERMTRLNLDAPYTRTIYTLLKHLK